MKHSQRANSEFGRPAGNSGEIRISRWTQSSQWPGLVIPISGIGAYIGKQARREETSRLLQGSDGHKASLCTALYQQTVTDVQQLTTNQLLLPF